jgi:cysteine-rich repeat protein
VDETGFTSAPVTQTAPMTAGSDETGAPGSSSTGAGETTESSPTESSVGGSSSSSTGDSETGVVTDGSTGGSTGSTGESTSVGEGGCMAGSQDCPCLGDDTCNDGLECEAGTCVVAAPPVCGDGMLAGMEECDDGPENDDTKQCKSDCTLQKCGDGAVGPGEACDDGNDVDLDACSNLCVPAACGDKVVQMGEDCDDGNLDNLDACIACKAAACGDTFVQAGVEECDDGNVIAGDGCSDTCKKEAPKCGGNFTLGWCPQAGTKEQSTRCESVSNGGKTCNNPFIKYGNLENGVPASHPGNDFNQWCTQLGFAGFSGQVSYGNRSCDPPQGRLFGCNGYDENIWHWCDWQDGGWYNAALNYHQCNDGQQITSVTCQ